jgi:hypothetical protein
MGRVLDGVNPNFGGLIAGKPCNHRLRANDNKRVRSPVAPPKLDGISGKLRISTPHDPCLRSVILIREAMAGDGGAQRQALTIPLCGMQIVARSDAPNKPYRPIHSMAARSCNENNGPS